MESNKFELNDEMLEKINGFSRKTLTADEVYAFPVILCDNEIDRDDERFSVEALQKLAELFVGKTGIFDHNPKGQNQTARIFDTEVKTDPDRVTSYGEPYVYLMAKAYMIRTGKSTDLIAEIEGGIKKEVSVSCSVKRQICSVCGADMKKTPCTHIKGAEYGGVVCSVILDEPYDAYEWSFVAVPAQKNAGVTKKYGGKSNKSGREFMAEIAQLRKENMQARDIIKREILRLSFLCSPLLTVKTVGILTDSMDFNQLIELKDNLEKDLQTKLLSDEVKAVKPLKSNNNNFKIN